MTKEKRGNIRKDPLKSRKDIEGTSRDTLTKSSVAKLRSAKRTQEEEVRLKRIEDKNKIKLVPNRHIELVKGMFKMCKGVAVLPSMVKYTKIFLIHSVAYIRDFHKLYIIN